LLFDHANQLPEDLLDGLLPGTPTFTRIASDLLCENTRRYADELIMAETGRSTELQWICDHCASMLSLH
jgi:hypothetical protein